MLGTIVPARRLKINSITVTLGRGGHCIDLIRSVPSQDPEKRLPRANVLAF